MSVAYFVLTCFVYSYPNPNNVNSKPMVTARIQNRVCQIVNSQLSKLGKVPYTPIGRIDSFVLSNVEAIRLDYGDYS